MSGTGLAVEQLIDLDWSPEQISQSPKTWHHQACWHILPFQGTRTYCLCAIAQEGGSKACFRAWRPAIQGSARGLRRAKRWCGEAARTQGGRSNNRLSKTEDVWGLGCPKTHHGIEDTLFQFFREY